MRLAVVLDAVVLGHGADCCGQIVAPRNGSRRKRQHGPRARPRTPNTTAPQSSLSRPQAYGCTAPVASGPAPGGPERRSGDLPPASRRHESLRRRVRPPASWHDSSMRTWSDGHGVVVLPSGRRVRGRALRRSEPPEVSPHYGVYFVSHEPTCTPWAHTWVHCRDFRCPADAQHTISALRLALDRAGDERVEVGCGGGVGRTGLGLAILTILDGVEPAAAVDWVRSRYHPRAVETPWQRRWVRRIGTEITG